MKKCPNCHIELDDMKMTLHERYCIQNIKYCNECKEAIPKEEFEEHLSHHLSRQQSKEIKNEKKEEIKNEEIKIKKEESQQLECQYCGELMSYKLIDEHENMCGARTDYCDVCGKLILLRNMKNHLKNHKNEDNMKMNKISISDLKYMNEDEQLARALAESMLY